jgi:hypothetical protein
MTSEQPDDVTPDPERVVARADDPTAEEAAVGSDDPEAQAEAILEESDERTLGRDGSPDADVEHRTSDQATLPPD